MFGRHLQPFFFTILFLNKCSSLNNARNSVERFFEDETNHTSTSLNETVCQDLNPNCRYWSNLIPSECKINPKYMHKNCPDSCYICEPESQLKLTDQPIELFNESYITCPKGWFTYKYSCYKILRDMGYDNALAECKKSNAQLMTIKDSEEAQYISNFIRSKEDFDEQAVVGLRSYGIHGLKKVKDWRWPQKSDYLQWASDEPSGDGDCAALIVNIGRSENHARKSSRFLSYNNTDIGKFNDIPCLFVPEMAICQMPRADSVMLIDKSNDTYISDTECLVDYKGDIVTENRKFYCTAYSCVWVCRLFRSFELLFRGIFGWQELFIIFLCFMFVVAVVIGLAFILIHLKMRYNQRRRASIELSVIFSTSSPNMSALRIIPLNELILEMDSRHKLGEGEFGAVYVAKYIIPKSEHKFPVVVKAIKNVSPTSEQELIREAGIMAQLDHPNLLRLIGICLFGGLKIVTPFRPLGSLNSYLKAKKNVLGPFELTNYCYQIVSAMEYLAEHKIVHRDLATRNVLVKHKTHVEITDFGLSILKREKEAQLPAKIPFRWVPIECLINFAYDNYGESSDVWAFGVTCWEVLSFAKTPYENLKFSGKNPLKTLYNFLEDGYRLNRPPNCGLEFYQTLLMCWAAHPDSRPKFLQLKEIFEKYKKDPFAYILDMRKESNKNKISIENDEDQGRIIANILGEDFYLAFDYDVYQLQKTNNETEYKPYDQLPTNFKPYATDDYLKLINNYLPHEYLEIIAKNKNYYKRRISDPEYLSTNEYLIPHSTNLFDNNHMIKRCNSYITLPKSDIEYK